MARHLYDVEVKGRPIRRGCLFWWVGSRLLPLSQHIGLTQRRLRPSNESGPRARGTIVVQRWQPFSFLIEWSWASNECCSQFTDFYPCLTCRTEDCVNWPKNVPVQKVGSRGTPFQAANQRLSLMVATRDTSFYRMPYGLTSKQNSAQTTSHQET